jgi:hypothetical protein
VSDKRTFFSNYHMWYIPFSLLCIKYLDGYQWYLDGYHLVPGWVPSVPLKPYKINTIKILLCYAYVYFG